MPVLKVRSAPSTARQQKRSLSPMYEDGHATEPCTSSSTTPTTPRDQRIGRAQHTQKRTLTRLWPLRLLRRKQSTEVVAWNVALAAALPIASPQAFHLAQERFNEQKVAHTGINLTKPAALTMASSARARVSLFTRRLQAAKVVNRRTDGWAH